ncbi:MAG: CsbD family protein [Actinomycetota bacterium]
MDDRGDRVAGKAKEATGKVTGDQRLETEGKTQRSKGKIKEKLREVTDTVRGAADGTRDRKQ